MPARMPDSMYTTRMTCHMRTPASRAAVALSPTANSSRPNPVRRSPKMMRAATGTNRNRQLGRYPNDGPAPMQRDRRGHDRGGRPKGGLVDRSGSPSDHEPRAERHDQRLHPEDADADAVERPDQPARDEAQEDARRPSPWLPIWVAMM